MAFGKNSARAGGVLLLVALLVAAVVVGAFAASAAQHVGSLRWLAYAQSFGFGMGKPFLLDLSVLRLSLGIELKLNVAQALCLVGAVLIYRRIR